LRFLTENEKLNITEDEIENILERFFLPSDRIEALKIILPFVETLTELTLNNKNIQDMFIMKINKDEVSTLIKNRYNETNQLKDESNREVLTSLKISGYIAERKISMENFEKNAEVMKEERRIEEEIKREEVNEMNEQNDKKISKIVVSDPKIEKSKEKKYTTYLIVYNVKQ
jgi:hypothetical protein